MLKFNNDETVFKTNFAENLRTAFENKKKSLEGEGFTQTVLGDKAGKIPQSAISKYLKGETAPSIFDMCRLALALDVPISYLCGFDESENTENKEESIFTILSDIIEEKYKNFIGVSCTDKEIEAIEADDKEHIWHPEHEDYIFKLKCAGDENHPKYNEMLHDLACERKNNPRCKIIVSTNNNILNNFIEEYRKVYESYRAFVLDVADEETTKQVYDTAVSTIIKKYIKLWNDANMVQQGDVL